MRTVTLVRSRGGNVTVDIPNEWKWDELKKDLEARGHIGPNQNFIEGTNFTTLESSMAELPEGDFDLFVTQKKSKFGSSLKEDLEILTGNVALIHTNLMEIISKINATEAIEKPVDTKQETLARLQQEILAELQAQQDGSIENFKVDDTDEESEGSFFPY